MYLAGMVVYIRLVDGIIKEEKSFIALRTWL